MSITHRLGVLLLISLAFLVGSSWQFAAGQGEKPKAKEIQKWEYHQARGYGEFEGLGNEGWEFVGTSPGGFFYFKRPK
jgi:hypothetical protein